MVFLMVCINSLVRKQWTEHEKLSYPIIQLPLELTSGGRTNLLTNKMMWLGFGIAGAIDILNGLHYLYPTVPSLGGRLYDLRPFFTQKPWSAVGWTPIAVFPFAVGMAFFIPLDLSFSCWFFYLFWKVERIFGDALGVRGMPNFPFTDEQSFGGISWSVRYRNNRDTKAPCTSWGVSYLGMTDALMIQMNRCPTE